MQELDRRGVVDTARIAVGGHSCAGRCCAGTTPFAGLQPDMHCLSWVESTEIRGRMGVAF